MFAYNRAALDGFFRENDPASVLFAIQGTGETCQLFSEVPNPEKFKKKGLIALRLSEESLTPQNVMSHIVFLELTKNVCI